MRTRERTDDVRALAIAYAGEFVFTAAGPSRHRSPQAFTFSKGE
jgi:hypothetical protein